jgi:hypothetical protein
MHNVVGKKILKATLAQIFINFYFYNPQICPKIRKLFLIMLGKNNLKTFTTSNKYNSLIEVQAMLKFRECFSNLYCKVDWSLTQIQQWIWKK